MSHADALRAAHDEATDTYVSGLIGPLEDQIADTSAALVEARAEVARLATQVCPDPAAHVEPEPWRLIEDVDLSDPTGWVSETGKPGNAEGYDLPRNVEFTSEGLRLWGRRESYQGHAFTAADTKGTGHPIPNYCRVEVTGRAVHEVGLWPCVLWLRPMPGSPLAAEGEIDFMENFGMQPRVAATLHNGYGSGHKMIHGNVPWRNLANPDPAAFHTYVMEKTPGRIRITCDEQVMMDVGPASPKPTYATPDGFDWNRIFEADRQWYPRVTMQVSAPGKATGTPAADFREADLLVTSLRIFAPNA